MMKKTVSNNNFWIYMFLSRKRCVLTNSYTFWPSGKQVLDPTSGIRTDG